MQLLNVYPVLDLYLGAVNIELTSILKYVFEK